jgi:hypothetical protein
MRLIFMFVDKRTGRRWLDDVGEWCNADITSAVRMAQNRQGFWAKK